MLTSRVTVPRLFREVPEADTRDEMSSVFRADNGTLSVFRNCSDKQFLLAPLSSKAFTLIASILNEFEMQVPPYRVNARSGLLHTPLLGDVLG